MDCAPCGGGSNGGPGARFATAPPVSGVAINRSFYDALWSASRLVPPYRFNTWPLLSVLADGTSARLEIGAGLRPRLPIDGTYFVDVSQAALVPLRGSGGFATHANAAALPFPDCAFEMVCAFDVVEHVDEDGKVLREIARVTKDDAVVVLSMPLHPSQWSAFDVLVGHVRRYEPDNLATVLREHSLVIERSAAFGMQPRSRWLLDLAVWGLTRRRDAAMRWYNRVLLPLGLLTQKRLEWAAGLVCGARVDELVLVCRRMRRAPVHGSAGPDDAVEDRA